MENELTHELTAGYALHALDPEEEQLYEAHLGRCRSCQADLADFALVTAALAHASPPAIPPLRLRRRVLAAARAERGRPPIRRPRWAYPALGVAVAASCTAAALAVWAIGVRSGPGVRALALRGASGALVVAGNRSAVLVASGLAPAPVGKTYEIWVMRAGGPSRPAGLFAARNGTVSVRLAGRVAHGSFVGVTLERAGGTARPSGPPLVRTAPL